MAEEAKAGEGAPDDNQAAAAGEEGADGDAEEENDEELKEDEAGYTVLGNNRPTTKTVFSMYSKSGINVKSPILVTILTFLTLKL